MRPQTPIFSQGFYNANSENILRPWLKYSTYTFYADIFQNQVQFWTVSCRIITVRMKNKVRIITRYTTINSFLTGTRPHPPTAIQLLVLIQVIHEVLQVWSPLDEGYVPHWQCSVPLHLPSEQANSTKIVNQKIENHNQAETHQRRSGVQTIRQNQANESSIHTRSYQRSHSQTTDTQNDQSSNKL